jgi:hypothetical protein
MTYSVVEISLKMLLEAHEELNESLRKRGPSVDIPSQTYGTLQGAMFL